MEAACASQGWERAAGSLPEADCVWVVSQDLGRVFMCEILQWYTGQGLMRSQTSSRSLKLPVWAILVKSFQTTQLSRERDGMPVITIGMGEAIQGLRFTTSTQIFTPTTVASSSSSLLRLEVAIYVCKNEAASDAA